MAEANHHGNEYDEDLITTLELIWGKGFMAPGGEGNVRRIVDGLELADKTVLEIGSGIGGGALLLAGEYGARVIGCEIEAPLVERARRYAAAAGLEHLVEFQLSAPGPLLLAEASVDVVYTSGVFIHIQDKPEAFADVLRVLKPGGVFTGYDWLRGPQLFSQDMLRWIELEGLTYYMDTLENYVSMLGVAGFQNVAASDASDWYVQQAQREYEQMQEALYGEMTTLLGPEKRDYFLEDWKALQVVLGKGELRMGYFRGHKPDAH